MRWSSSLWVTLAVAAAALAQVRLAPPRLSGESQRAAQRLAEAQDLVAQGQYADAIEEFQRLLTEAGDELLPIDPQQPHHLLPVRCIIQQRLAALPAAALRLYRGRVDPLAQKLLDQGRAQREPRLLQRIVAESFCSRHTDQALDLLGDLAFERGDFEEAERCWRMLTPPEKPDPLALVYPDPRTDAAQVKAKLLLARWCRGERQDAERRLAAYRQQHGQALGHLAGRQGNYADILTELANQLAPLAVSDDATWPTFAGSPTRQHMVATPPRCQWLSEPWRAPIEGAIPAAPGLSPSQTALAYAYHPVIVADRVIVADPRGVTVHDLWTGKRLGRWDLVEELKVEIDGGDKQAQGVRYTLSVAQDRIFARLGAADAVGDSYLVCLNLTAAKPTLRWQVKLEAVKDGTLGFEGSPVVAGERVLIAWTRFSQGRYLTGIDCYDAASGARRWRQEVSESREPIKQPQHLLSLAGPQVLCCNHGGAVVALDQETGKRAWALRYPRRGYLTADGLLTPRDLAPPLAAAGRVYVAPADSDSIWCLDPVSGRVLWQSQPIEVVHLLGVAGKRLIFTTGNRPRGIQALDAASGLLLRDWIYPGDGQTELPSLGRGFLAGDQVFFPRVNGWDILKQADGRPDLDRFVPLGGLPPGNMACAAGCLVVATDRELLGYVPADRQLPERRQSAIERRSPRSLLRLAQAEAAAGHYADALLHLDQAMQRADHPARTEALHLQHQVWIALRNQPAELMTLIDRPDVASIRGPLLALAAQAQARPQAAAIWQRLLADAALCRGTILDEKGLPQPAGLHAARQIDILKAGADPSPHIHQPPSLGKARRSLPELGISLEIDGETALDGEMALPLDGACLLLDSQGHLTCRSGTGKELWSRASDIPISWLGRHGDILIAGGSAGIVRLNPASGDIVWSIHWPAWEWSSYQQQGGRLWVRLDRCRLLAIDLSAGRSDWVVDAASEFTDYQAAEGCVLARTAGGVGWVIDARGGQKDLSFAAQAPWRGLPIRLDETSLTVLSTPTQVVMLDRSTGKSIWQFTLDRATSLSGEMPWLIHHGEALIVVVPRNHAVELIRLDRRDGKPTWRRSLPLSRASTAVDQVGTDGQSVFVVANQTLHALALANGRTSWSAALPADESWRLAVSRDLVIVHPAQARTRTDLARLIRRLSAADPTTLLPSAGTHTLGTALTTITTTVIDGQSPSLITLLTYDPATGKRVQQLELAGQGPRLTVTLLPERLLVAASNRLWSFR